MNCTTNRNELADDDRSREGGSSSHTSHVGWRARLTGESSLCLVSTCKWLGTRNLYCAIVLLCEWASENYASCEEFSSRDTLIHDARQERDTLTQLHSSLMLFEEFSEMHGNERAREWKENKKILESLKAQHNWVSSGSLILYGILCSELMLKYTHDNVAYSDENRARK